MTSLTWDIDRIRVVVREWDIALREALPKYARPKLVAPFFALGPPIGKSPQLKTVSGVALPPSYRAFLAVSDGADAGVFGADHVERWYGERRGGLLGTETLRASNESVDWQVRMWGENARDFAHRQDRPPKERRPR